MNHHQFNKNKQKVTNINDKNDEEEVNLLWQPSFINDNHIDISNNETLLTPAKNQGK
jgi:hypothetical protein